VVAHGIRLPAALIALGLVAAPLRAHVSSGDRILDERR